MKPSRSHLAKLCLIAAATPAGAQQTTERVPVADIPSAGPATALQFQWGDFDADGLEDALAISANGTVKLLRNRGDGSFEDFTAHARLDGVAEARFALWEDIDNDGLVDLFVGTASGPSYLMYNAGGFFVDITQISGLTSNGFDRSAHWVDYDGDGVLDLHLVQATSNTMYHGLAAGGFEAIELPTLFSETAPATSATPGAVPEPNGAGTTGGATNGRRDVTPRGRTTTSGSSAFSSSGLPGSTGTSAAASSANILACVQSLRDANGGSCIEASATATLGMLYPMTSSFNVNSSGDVGIGTTGQTTKLHIVGGDDAAAGANPSDGFLMLGSAGGLNTVIDNNEVMARSVVAPSPLYLNRDGAHVIVGGVNPGNLGVGTSFPEARLDVDNRVLIDSGIHGGFVNLRNQAGINVIETEVDGNGGNSELRNHAGQTRVLTGVNSNDHAFLVLRSPADADAVHAHVEPTGGRLDLNNNSEDFRVVHRIDTNDAGESTLFGGNGNLTVRLGSTTAGNLPGYVETWQGSFRLVRIGNPASNSGSGLIRVFDNSISVIRLDGDTGAITGTSKSFVQPHPTDATQQIRYVSLEGPEHGVYFRGTAEIRNGVAHIEVPESFRLVASGGGLTVNVTPLGPTSGLYVSHKGLDYIAVQEMPGEFADVTFDYQVMGVRSALEELEPFEENVNFIAEPGLAVDVEDLPGNYGELMVQNGTLLPDGTVNEQTAVRLGWSFDGEGWSHPSFPGNRQEGESARSSVAHEEGTDAHDTNVREAVAPKAVGANAAPGGNR